MFSLFNDPQRLALLALVLLISLTIHEFAHAWTAYKLGDDTAEREGRVTLNPIVHLDLMGSLCFLISGGIGWARPVPVNPTNFRHPRRDDILVTGAGPASNLLLGSLSAIFYFTMMRYGWLRGNEFFPFIQSFLSLMIVANFSLAFFNLIPLFPLDGSHIVTNLLPLNEAYRFKRFNEEYGAWTLLILIMLPFFTNRQIDVIGWVVRTPVRALIDLFSRIF